VESHHCLWITNFSTDISFVCAKVSRNPLIKAQVIRQHFGLVEVEVVLSSWIYKLPKSWCCWNEISQNCF